MSRRTAILWFACVIGILFLGLTPASRAAIVAPTDISGSVLWLDAADAATVVQTTDTGFVEQWTDKSTAGGGDVSQSTLANKPATGTTTLGGLNVLTLDGGDWLAGSAVLAGGDDDFSYFAVWQPHITGGAQAVFEQSQSPSVNGTRASLLLVGDRYGFNGQSNDAHNLVPFTANEWRLADVVVDGNVFGNVHVYDNGNPEVIGGISIGAQNTGTTGTRVGAKLTNNGENLDGDLAEIVVYDRVLTDGQRNEVLYYLQEKWSLSTNIAAPSTVLRQYEFEDGLLPSGWTATGTAFDTPITRSSRSEFGESGSWFLGSFENETAGGNAAIGDGPTGTLTGDSFVLNGNTIRALVGGGHHLNTQLRLEHEVTPGTWEIVRKDSGPNDERMREIRWNVSNLQGETVRFTMFDGNSGGWGHVNADNLRVLNEAQSVTMFDEFDGPTLDPALIVYRPVDAPGAALNGAGQFEFDLRPGGGSYNLWSTVNDTPQLLLEVDPDDTRGFVLETHLVDRTFTGLNNHTGLLLSFEDPSATTWDPVMFGPYRDNGIQAEGPTFGPALNALGGTTIDDVYLRIEYDGQDVYDFLYSLDGTDWISMGTKTFTQDLLSVGLFGKDWGMHSNLVSQFDYLHFTAVPEPSSLVLLVMGGLTLVLGARRRRRGTLKSSS